MASLKVQDSLVICGDDELKPFINNPNYAAILNRPGMDVGIKNPDKFPAAVKGKYELRIVQSLLVQSRGKTSAKGTCESCVKGLGIYDDCLVLDGYFKNACGNCKRKDHAARCSVADQEQELPQASTTEEKVIQTRSGRTIKAPTK